MEITKEEITEENVTSEQIKKIKEVIWDWAIREINKENKNRI